MSKIRFQSVGKSFEVSEQSLGIQISKRPGGWALIEWKDSKGQVQRSRAKLRIEKGQAYFHFKGRTWFGKWAEQSHGASHHEGAGDSDLVSQFPGKVRKLLVQAGSKVKEGDPLLVVEAMKMEFTIKAPADGQVKKLHVQEGQQIMPGTRYLDFEEAEEKT